MTLHATRTRAPLAEPHIIRTLNATPPVTNQADADRRMHALVGHTRPLLTPPASQTKASKNEVPTWTLGLQPADTSGSHNLCAHATTCVAPCIAETGQYSLPAGRAARDWRTRLLLEDPHVFYWQLDRGLIRSRRPVAAARLNAISDVRHEHIVPDLVARWINAGIILYDYTKYPPGSRALFHLLGGHLTYSYAGGVASARRLVRHMDRGGNAAFVIAIDHQTGQDIPLPTRLYGFPTIDGDVTDWRPGDLPGHAVLLRAKGPLRREVDAATLDTFVHPLHQQHHI